MSSKNITVYFGFFGKYKIMLHLNRAQFGYDSWFAEATKRLALVK